jgi:hypothetical protein
MGAAALCFTPERGMPAPRLVRRSDDRSPPRSTSNMRLRIHAVDATLHRELGRQDDRVLRAVGQEVEQVQPDLGMRSMQTTPRRSTTGVAATPRCATTRRFGTWRTGSDSMSIRNPRRTWTGLWKTKFDGHLSQYLDANPELTVPNARSPSIWANW